MSMGCMRCNKEGCGGLVVYEDADYDYREAILEGSYTVDDNLVCETCGRKFKAIISHVFVHEENGDIEELDSACITEWLNKYDSR